MTLTRHALRPSRTSRPVVITAALVGLAATSLASPVVASGAPGSSGGSGTSATPAGPADGGHRRPPVASPALPLGPSTLAETRTSRTLQPGVTHTTIVRGAADPSLRWVVELSIPSGATSPDPDAPARSVQDRADATAFAASVTAKGFPATASPVDQPRAADVPAGTIGYRVRLTTTHPTKAAADAAVAALKTAGVTGRSWYTGWDGGNPSGGPWTVQVVTIDPRTFKGTLGGTYGPDLERRETTSALAAFTRADVAINAGFFVMDPAAGAEGDPAGAAAYDGVLESEPIAGRPALVLDEHARRTAIVRPTWTGELRTRTGTLTLDGYNRVPGLIRNCGGDASDRPTSLPLHDVTCTDADELVAFTPAFGATTPQGAGTEVVIGRRGVIEQVRGTRGVALRPGQTSVQAIGAAATTLASLPVGSRARVDARLTAPGDRHRSLLRPGTSVINGGPQLLRDGRIHITQKADGMNQTTNPSFDYGWVLQRNPRTFAGVDAAGRTLLVTVDGRQLGELGLSIPETAAVAQALGMRDAINLDGGGSTAMVLDGALVTHPSDATGERAVGDAIYVR